MTSFTNQNFEFPQGMTTPYNVLDGQTQPQQPPRPLNQGPSNQVEVGRTHYIGIESKFDVPFTLKQVFDWYPHDISNLLQQKQAVSNSKKAPVDPNTMSPEEKVKNEKHIIAFIKDKCAKVEFLQPQKSPNKKDKKDKQDKQKEDDEMESHWVRKEIHAEYQNENQAFISSILNASNCYICEDKQFEYQLKEQKNRALTPGSGIFKYCEKVEQRIDYIVKKGIQKVPIKNKTKGKQEETITVCVKSDYYDYIEHNIVKKIERNFIQNSHNELKGAVDKEELKKILLENAC